MEKDDSVPCLTDDGVGSHIAKLGREASWLSAQHTTRWCLNWVAGGERERSASAACMDLDVANAVAVCVYGHEASGVITVRRHS